MSEQGRSFDVVANDYLKARSDYPVEMFDRIFDTASLKPGSRVLEIGCGSGQATLEFVKRGSRVVAIDPAKRALDLLAQRSGDFVDLELVHSKFEDFDERRQFDLIACGQAFHWLDLNTAPDRFAELLKRGGHVALFWHLQDVKPESPQADLYLLSSKYFKSFPVMNPPEYGREFIDAMADILEKSGRFEEIRVLEYPWQQSYEPDVFKALFRSASSYSQLDETSKQLISSDLDAYMIDLPGDPEICYRTCLVEARVSGT